MKYLPQPRLSEVACTGDVRSAVEALVEAVKLPSGNLHDDVAIILTERVVQQDR